MAYKVQLDAYQGPMDLLLFLIRRNEVNINDIPIAEITRQYLEYIQLMRLLDLDIAGDFIVIASTLIRIKARLLLPQTEEEGEDEEDPRQELVRNLLEYQEFKKVAENLEDKELEARNIFYRSFPFDPDTHKDDMLLDVSLFDLLSAFKEALAAAPDEAFHEVERTDVTIEERTTFIMQYLTENKRVQFFDMFPRGTSRLVLVVTFIAMLELIKNQKVRIGQSGSFGEIWIYLAAEDTDIPADTKEQNTAEEPVSEPVTAPAAEATAEPEPETVPEPEARADTPAETPISLTLDETPGPDTRDTEGPEATENGPVASPDESAIPAAPEEEKKPESPDRPAETGGNEDR